MKRNASRLNKQHNKFANRLNEFRDISVIKTMERSTALADDIHEMKDDIEGTIRILNNYGTSDSHIKLPAALKEATELLDDIKLKYGQSKRRPEVLEWAQRQYDLLGNKSEVLQRQNKRLDDYMYEVLVFNDRMQHFERLNKEVFNNATLTETFSSKNRRKMAEVERKLQQADEMVDEVDGFLDENILAETAVKHEQIKDNHLQLAQNKNNLKYLNDALEHTIVEFDEKFEGLVTNEVPAAKEHANRLKKESDEFQQLFKDTEEGAANAMKASMAYENIVAAIVSAQESADNATDSGRVANNKVYPLGDVSLVERSEHAANVSSNIEKKAHKELEKANELNEVMVSKEKQVESLQYKMRLAGVDNNRIVEEEGLITRGDAMKKLQGTLDQANIVSDQMKFVREEAGVLNSDVYKLKLKLAKLEPEWDTKFGMAEENVSQSLSNILKAKKELSSVEKLEKIQSEKFRTWNASFSAQLQELKDKIARAKHAAEGVSIICFGIVVCMLVY